MTVISLDSITYLLTAIGPLCCRPNALSYPHATKSFKPDAGVGQHQGTIGVYYGRICHYSVLYRKTAHSLSTFV